MHMHYIYIYIYIYIIYIIYRCIYIYVNVYIYIYICIYIYMYYVCVLNNCMQCEQQTLRYNFDMRSLNYWYRCYNTTLPHFARLKFKGTS